MSRNIKIGPSLARADMSVEGNNDPTIASVKIHEQDGDVYRMKPGSRFVIRSKNGTPIATIEMDE